MTRNRDFMTEMISCNSSICTTVPKRELLANGGDVAKHNFEVPSLLTPLMPASIFEGLCMSQASRSRLGACAVCTFLVERRRDDGFSSSAICAVSTWAATITTLISILQSLKFVISLVSAQGSIHRDFQTERHFVRVRWTLRASYSLGDALEQSIWPPAA